MNALEYGMRFIEASSRPPIPSTGQVMAMPLGGRHPLVTVLVIDHDGLGYRLSLAGGVAVLVFGLG